jgi:POT family proton-dependent oligopeptide transporter
MEEKQPKALYYLFLTEMWERFGYFTMATLFVLYLTSTLDMTDDRAFVIFGAYTSFAYLTTVVGGIIADRLLGFRWSIMIGAATMSAGYLLLPIQSLPTMYLALGILVVGNGLFKPNVSALLGQFYGEDDPRRDGGFTIFYMGINLGAFVASVIAGIVATQLGYGFAFAMAGVGKLISLITFVLARRQLGTHGFIPKTSPLAPGEARRTAIAAGLIASGIGLIGIATFLIKRGVLDGEILAVIGLGATAFFLFEISREEPKNRPKLFSFVVLVGFAVVFFAVYMQAYSSIVLYTKRDVDLELLGFAVPPSDIQSLNPMFILLLAPVFALVWRQTTKAGINVSVPFKFVLGLFFIGSAFLLLRLGGLATGSEGKVDLSWMVAFFFLYTMGEMSLSPVGLSMATALAPQRLAGFAMGMWMLSISGANYISGRIAEIASVPAGTAEATERQIYEAAFADYGWIALSAGLILLGLVPILRRMMR